MQLPPRALIVPPGEGGPERWQGGEAAPKVHSHPGQRLPTAPSPGGLLSGSRPLPR
jgi:hypothetical protein